MNLLKVSSIVTVLCAFTTHCQAQFESKDRYLTLPQLDKCNNRFKEFQYKNRNYFYSGHDPELKDKKFDWLDARNTCRNRCMETVSFENQEKFDFFKNFIANNNITFVWTSGRLCDFEGCEGRWDLLPKRIKGWLWSANQIPIAPTNKTPPGWKYQPWSHTGIRNRTQPDNGEFYISQTPESCVGILNNMYNDSVAWHDIACYHNARFICEDSELLLKEVLEKKEDNAVESTSAGTETIPTTENRVLTTKREIEDNEAPTPMRRRKISRKKLKPIIIEEVETNKTGDENNLENNDTTDTMPTLMVERENIAGNEKLDSTDVAHQRREENFLVVEEISEKENDFIEEGQIIEEENVFREEEEKVFRKKEEIVEEEEKVIKEEQQTIKEEEKVISEQEELIEEHEIFKPIIETSSEAAEEPTTKTLQRSRGHARYSRPMVKTLN